MVDQTHCPKCKTEPWNTTDGSGGVCPACQVKAASSAEASPAPKVHHHYYRKDGTCSCGKKRGK